MLLANGPCGTCAPAEPVADGGQLPSDSDQQSFDSLLLLLILQEDILLTDPTYKH